jgi:DNA invertase Pin-like site-specific DNA recombinase
MPASNSTNGRPLRFAALVRVSTEKQERQGESLRSQLKNNQSDIDRLGGAVVGWYGGQEHATPGWEKEEVDRLLADAAKGKFDAVIVAYADRWSRDNAKSKEGLEVFRKRGVRFFVGTTEMDLFDPQHRFILGMNAEVGEFISLQQAKKSIESRIDRARRGLPAAGPLPYGRTFDPKTEEWGIDPAKQALVADVAARYLAGESLPKLAKEYGRAYSNLYQILRERSGKVWVQKFHADALNVHESVPTPVPPLLDEETIRAVRQRLDANTTYLHGRPKHDYLLNGRIFCSGCGYLMTGQPKHGRLYYRHHRTERKRECPYSPRPWVLAEDIENRVVARLLDLFGDPAILVRATRDAVPDCREERTRRGRLQEEVARTGRARDRILALVAKDALTDDQAEAQLRSLKEREADLRAELDTLEAVLANVPSEADVSSYAERIAGLVMSRGSAVAVYGDDGRVVTVFDDTGGDQEASAAAERHEHRQLIEAVFSRPQADGTPAGVYVHPPGEGGEGRWGFTIRGTLDFGSVMRYSRH